MLANPAGMPPRYLRTLEAARFVGHSIRTLEKHRTYGTGPRYSKLGGRVHWSSADMSAGISEKPMPSRPRPAFFAARRGVVGDVSDAVERDAKPFGDELSKACFVPLSRGHRAYGVRWQSPSGREQHPNGCP
jgi:predicted DNA-binding transcriptional regulator AlpA